MYSLYSAYFHFPHPEVKKQTVSLSVQTRILVTHGVSFLPYVDEIVVLVDGVVSEVGSYSSLRASKGAFSEFLDTYAKEQSNQSHSETGNCTFFSLHCG